MLGEVTESGLKYPESADVRFAIQDMQFENIDQQAACLTDHDQKYHQISRGKYQGQFRTVLLGEQVALYFETFNQTLDQWGASPSDRYGFIFFMDPTNFGHLGNNSFTGEDILFLPPGHSFDFRCTPQTRFCVVSIDHIAFEQLVHDGFEADTALTKLRHQTSIIRDPDCVCLLRQIITFIVRRLRLQQGNDLSAGTELGAKRSLCELLAGIVAHPQTAGSVSKLHKTETSVGLVRCIRDHIRNRRGIAVGPDQLAEEFSVSRRHLERIFRSKLGPVDIHLEAMMTAARCQLAA
ncbi:hypothetical protein [Pseudophaeobacter sp. TrK17]|uniref:hypothetical protein n=1 Tax=Pseudophaeobacter sp. TrK17 TaxID=2815167 RepID=UPI0035D0D8CA